MKSINTIAVVALGCVIILSFIFMNKDVESKDLDEVQYCEMVKLYKQSNGRNGWPDFRASFKRDCK